MTPNITPANTFAPIRTVKAISVRNSLLTAQNNIRTVYNALKIITIKDRYVNLFLMRIRSVGKKSTNLNWRRMLGYLVVTVPMHV